jgi:hypothetical protein
MSKVVTETQTQRHPCQNLAGQTTRKLCQNLAGITTKKAFIVSALNPFLGSTTENDIICTIQKNKRFVVSIVIDQHQKFYL